MIPSWRDEALCAQTDWRLFHQEMGAKYHQAARVCAACPVRVPCLEDALAWEDSEGFRGGCRPEEIRKLLRLRRAAERRAAA